MTLRTTEPISAPVEQDEASRVLSRAADLLEEHGWVQRQYGDPVIGFCLVGAIDWVTFGQTDIPPSGVEIFEIEARLFRSINLDSGSLRDRNALTGWNDTWGRTKDEVVAALREAAKEGRSDP